MDMASVIVLYGISVLCIVLGFIALLKQRLYLDEKTQEPTAIELPLVGKLKTNYPALVFLIIAALFAMAASQESKTLDTIHAPPTTDAWTLTGSLTNPPGKEVKWADGKLTLIPQPIFSTIYEDGQFEIHVPIERGKSIEDFYKTLDCTLPEGNVQIDLVKECQAAKAGRDSQITHISANALSFKPITINSRDRPPQN
jgi:hypothetical protein